NNPSDDQPVMQENTNSISNWIDVDHVGFNNAKGGIHNVVRLPNQSSVTPGPGLGDGDGLIFSALSSTVTSMFWKNALGVNRILGPNVVAASGTAYLPGNMVIQWGTGNATTAAPIINFATAFTTCYSVVVTPINASGVGPQITIDSISATGFKAITAISSQPFNYIAVGSITVT